MKNLLQRLAQNCDMLIEAPDSPEGKNAKKELSLLLEQPHDMQAIIALAKIGYNVSKIEAKTKVGISILCDCDYQPSFLVLFKACFWRLINSLFPLRKNNKLHLEKWIDIVNRGEMVEYAGRMIRRRPRVLDEAVKDDVFEAIKPDIISLYGLDEAKDERNLAALKKAFMRLYDLDGCRTAWGIEMECAWAATWGFANIIESAPHEMILQRHIRKWIDDENVSPVCEQGQKVKWSRGEGVIDRVRDKYSAGCYAIIRTDITVEDPTRRDIVPWEECRPVEEA